jgi:hypothetical protein
VAAPQTVRLRPANGAKIPNCGCVWDVHVCRVQPSHPFACADGPRPRCTTASTNRPHQAVATLVPAQRIQPAARRFQAGVLRPLGHGGTLLRRRSCPAFWPSGAGPRTGRTRATGRSPRCRPRNLAAVDDAAASGGGDASVMCQSATPRSAGGGPGRAQHPSRSRRPEPGHRTPTTPALRRVRLSDAWSSAARQRLSSVVTGRGSRGGCDESGSEERDIANEVVLDPGRHLRAADAPKRRGARPRDVPDRDARTIDGEVNP